MARLVVPKSVRDDADVAYLVAGEMFFGATFVQCVTYEHMLEVLNRYTMDNSFTNVHVYTRHFQTKRFVKSGSINTLDLRMSGK